MEGQGDDKMKGSYIALGALILVIFAFITLLAWNCFGRKVQTDDDFVRCDE